MQYLRISGEKNLPRMVSVQNEYSLLYRTHEPDLFEISMRENVGLLAWSPLATGMLTGKYANGKIPDGTRWTMIRKQNQRNTPQAHKAVDAYLSIAKKHSLDPGQMALAFVTSRPFVTANIIGATTMEQLKSNIASFDIKLSPEILKEIDLVRRDFPIPY
jgi:aryl-alcohol dehydrogenase-like predicted oxidoreductase